MRGYLAILSARFRTLLQYRSAAAAALFTQCFFGFVRIMILDGFYQGAHARAPMKLPEVIGYIWMTQAMLRLLPWWVDPDVREQVQTGTVAYELCRPLDLYNLWFARALAWRTAPVLLRLVPMLVFAMIVVPLVGLGAYRLAPPPSAAAALAWLASFVLAVLLSSAITTLMNIAMLWTLSAQGIPLLVSILATVLGGLIIPLPLFPDWAQPIVYGLPFAGLLDLPARVYTGNLSFAQAAWVPVHQLAWTIALVALGRWTLSRGVRRLVVQGG